MGQVLVIRPTSFLMFEAQIKIKKRTVKVSFKIFVIRSIKKTADRFFSIYFIRYFIIYKNEDLK